MMAKVSIPEAARRLGVSPATVRRKLHSGELQGFQEDPPQGRWWVELPDDLPDPPFNDDPALREVVAILREELAQKNRQIAQLHILLQQAQAALPAPAEDKPRPWWRFWR